MRILVIGGTGKVGRPLAAALVKKGVDVRVLSRAPAPGKAPPDAELVAGDLSRPESLPHAFENVDLAILKGHFGVAENGAVWITDKLMGDRSIPFISQHLALVINKQDIVPTLQEAYERIDYDPYEYGTVIAGPSKTADIEQSLVLGAHGPKSLIVFLMSAD